jgi:hypothetical protein
VRRFKILGYDAASASPKLAEVLLRSQKSNLIVLSKLSDFDLHRIINLADGADILVLEGFTSPSELLFLVAQRLNHRQRRAQPARPGVPMGDPLHVARNGSQLTRTERSTSPSGLCRQRLSCLRLDTRTGGMFGRR